MPDAAWDAAPADGAADAELPDAELPDAELPDAATVDPDCPVAPDEYTVALYTFDADPPTRVLDDGLAGVSGSIVGTISRVGGRCGDAIHFSRTDPTPFVGIVDSPWWDLPVGSIDFWMRASSFGSGVLSRDALGNVENGHMTVYVGDTGHVVVRMQSRSDDNAVFRCSDAPIPLGAWVRVGINFGAPGVELWVDGVLSSRDENVPLDSARGLPTAFCANNAPVGIEGNSEPWLFGGASDRSAVGVGYAESPFADGELDQVRVSSVRRDYSAP